MSNKITFRLLTINDIDQMYIWLKKPYVHEWFANEHDIAIGWVEKVFGDKSKFIQRWIFQINGVDVGYIQNYFYEDDDAISLEYKTNIGTNDGVAGLDFFIGNENYIHMGYGKLILKQFLEDIIFVDPRCKSIIIGPRPKNRASIKTLEANGFKWYKNVVDDKGRDEYMMILHC